MRDAWRDALTSFEQITGLRVTIHDHTGNLWRHVDPRRFSHRHPVCLSVKTGAHGPQCMEFELRKFRSQRERWPEGRVHRCHAGLVELAYVVWIDGAPAVTLFAGPGRISDVTRLDVASPLTGAADDVRSAVSVLPQLDKTERELLELLRQLGARIRELYVSERGPQPSNAIGGRRATRLEDAEGRQNREEITRRSVIDRFVAESVATSAGVEVLAARLGLTVDRARHVVVEECGEPISRLVRRARMGAAASLLSGTGLRISEVALRCGYQNPSAFARTFADEMGTSPTHWRKTHGA